MIIPTQSSSYDQDQALPPPYQESASTSQRLPTERRSSSLYAPPVSPRPDLPPKSDRESEPNLDYPDEKRSVGFPQPRIATERTYSDPLFSPSKGKEKGRESEGPAQRAFDMFSSIVWGTAPTASTSRSQNSASTAQNPLDPAPAAFTRPTPKNYGYLPFRPMTMLGISNNLANGFPTIPPPINSEDETGTGKANSQHPFVSHDVTEDDWLKFLTGLKTVASTPHQAQKSFLARMFLGEMSERDQRKRAIHFIDSWNHYFFQPRRMAVVLARGRRIFNGVGGHHHRRHSAGHGRGRHTDPNQSRHHPNRHRSHSTDSSSSDSSRSSTSSIRSTASEPPEMPIPHTHEPSPGGHSTKGHPGEHGPGPMSHSNYWINYGLQYSRRGLASGPGRRGWCPPGPSTVPQIRSGEPLQFPMSHDQKQAWKQACKAEKNTWKAEMKSWKDDKRVEKRGMRYEHRLVKRAMKHERRQRKLEARVRRHGEGRSRGDQPWKLIVSYHGASREAGQS